MTENEIVERFWSKVDKSAGLDGCWLWMGALCGGGYGRFRIDGYTRISHRLSLEWAIGPCPSGLYACHSCRNKHCVNPSHLRWDTPGSNQYDRNKDGTDNRGERHGLAKLTENQVIEIREAMAAGSPQADVAKRYGVSCHTVGRVANGRSWQHVGGQLCKNKGFRGERNGSAKLTAVQVLEIRSVMAAGGESKAACARRYGVSDSVVHNIIRRRIWKHLPEVAA